MTEETRLILDEIKNLRGEITGLGGNLSNLENEITGLKGNVTDLKDDVTGLKSDVNNLKDDVTVLRGDVNNLKDDINNLENKINEVKTELGAEFRKEISVVEANLKEEINELKTTFEKRFERIEKSMDTTRFILENEIRDNIRLVAEGHLDLHRKMEDVAKTNNEKEIMFMRLKYLESEVRVIKDKFGIA